MNSHNRPSSYDAVIVGAGVIGCAAAIVLSQLGYRVALVDSASAKPEMPSNLRATAIGEHAKRLLQDLDVWQELSAEQVHPYTAMRVWDENSEGELDFYASELGYDELGHICDHFALQRFLQLHSQEQLDVFFEAELVSINNIMGQGVNIELSNARSLQAKLLIAADGVNSSVRQKLDVPTSSQSYRQTAIVAQVKTQKPHQNTAWQRFLSTGPLAFLPLGNGNSSIVWSIDDDQANVLLELNKEEFSQRLMAASLVRLGNISIESQRFAFPLNSIRANQYYYDQVLLIGDAAHGIHPLAGQGANLGLADVVALKEELSSTPPLDACRKYLRRYERRRKVKNYATDAAMSGINSAFLAKHPALSISRGIGMNLINSRTTLKGYLADIAMRG